MGSSWREHRGVTPPAQEAQEVVARPWVVAEAEAEKALEGGAGGLDGGGGGGGKGAPGGAGGPGGLIIRYEPIKGIISLTSTTRESSL